jgi:hypothetical protein
VSRWIGGSSKASLATSEIAFMQSKLRPGGGLSSEFSFSNSSCFLFSAFCFPFKPYP